MRRLINSWFCRFCGEQTLPLSSVESGKEKRRHEHRHSSPRTASRGPVPRSLSIETGRVGIHVMSGANRPRCPICGIVSSRVHSRYRRTVSDLPWHGISVELEVRARRFFCDESSCERRIFCERLPDVAARARKTGRLEAALLAIVLELGGRAGARLADELGLAVGRDAFCEGRRAHRCRAVGR